MPTYEYQCNDCGTPFDVFHAMNASPVSKCPGCGGAVTRKVSGGAGLIFKGSGFHATDYAKTPCGKCPQESQCGGADKECRATPPCAH